MKKVFLLSIFPFFIFFLWRGIGFDGLYGQDAYEYLRYANELSAHLTSKQALGFFFWPVYYPITGVLFEFILKDMSLALQLVSITAWSISTVCLHKIIQLLYPENKTSFPYIFLCFLLSPMVIRIGSIIMSDMLATCFILISCFHALKYMQRTQKIDLYIFSIVSVNALLTRYASFVILLPFFLSVAFSLWKNRKDWIHIFPLILLVMVFGFPHFYLKSQTSFEFFSHGALTNWSSLNLFKSTFWSEQGELSYTFPNIIYGFSHLFHPRYLSIGFILIPLFFIKKLYTSFNAILVSSFILYSLFIAGINTQNSRFLFLAFPFGLIILFPAFDFIVQKIISNKIKWFVFIALTVFQIGLVIKGMQVILKRNALEKSIAAQIKAHQKNTLYSFDIDIAMKGRNLDFEYKNLWIEKYSKFEEGTLVLFHPSKFQEQWKGKNPILNWNTLNENYNLKVLENCSEGWKLYQIEK